MAQPGAYHEDPSRYASVELPFSALQALSALGSDLALGERTGDPLRSALAEDLFAPVGSEGFLEHLALTSHRLRLGSSDGSALDSALQLFAKSNRRVQAFSLTRCLWSYAREAFGGDLSTSAKAGKL